MKTKTALLIHPIRHSFIVNITFSTILTFLINDNPFFCMYRTVLYVLQVFQKVQVSIKVEEGRAGARRLVIGLVFNGVDYAEDAGQICPN